MEKEDVVEKDDEEKKEKNEVVDVSIDFKNLVIEEISENFFEE